MPNCALRLTLRGHSCNVGAVVFHPNAVKEEESPVCALASCAADGSIKLWTMKRYADFMKGYGINAHLSSITNSDGHVLHGFGGGLSPVQDCLLPGTNPI